MVLPWLEVQEAGSCTNTPAHYLSGERVSLCRSNNADSLFVIIVHARVPYELLHAAPCVRHCIAQRFLIPSDASIVSIVWESVCA